MESKDKYIILIYHKWKGTLSTEENLALNQWLEKSDANKKMADDIERQILNSGEILPFVENNYVNDYSAVLTKINKASRSSSRIQNIRSTLVAACTICLLGAFGWWFFSEVAVGGEWNTIVYDEHNSNIHKLIDGSELTLHKGSTVEYNFTSNKGRLLKLRGQAYFDVTKDKNNPFVIESKNGKIEVLGTEFMYKDFDSDPEMMVFVVEGKVQFESFLKPSKYILKKQDKIIFNKEQRIAAYEKSDFMNEVAWKTGEVEFSNTALPEVFEILSQQLDIEFQGDIENLKNCRFTMSNQELNLNKLVEKLTKLFNVKIVQNTDNSFFISGGSC